MYAVKNIQARVHNPIATRDFEVSERIRQIPHPCIVQLYHAHNFTDAGVYVLVMEFCPGGDLLKRVERARREGQATQEYERPMLALSWIGQIFLGLEHMHLRMETLMRDLKPENVVLSSNGHHAKLTDFGFGRFGVESNGRWSFGIPTGSPGYVAPEVLMQEEYDSRADLFSLGVLTWIVLTGGLTTIKEPVPPLGKRRHPVDYEAHFEDHEKLAQCIAMPESNGARSLKRKEEKEFILRLISRCPQDRMRHPQIRNHALLQHLQIPAYDAPKQAVEEWLQRLEVMK